MGKEILTYIAIVITLFSATPLFAQEKANKETIKQAEESFIAGNYTQAKKLYNQLVTYYQKIQITITDMELQYFLPKVIRLER